MRNDAGGALPIFRYRGDELIASDKLFGALPAL